MGNSWFPTNERTTWEEQYNYSSSSWQTKITTNLYNSNHNLTSSCFMFVLFVTTLFLYFARLLEKYWLLIKLNETKIFKLDHTEEVLLDGVQFFLVGIIWFGLLNEITGADCTSSQMLSEAQPAVCVVFHLVCLSSSQGDAATMQIISLCFAQKVFYLICRNEQDKSMFMKLAPRTRAKLQYLRTRVPF